MIWALVIFLGGIFLTLICAATFGMLTDYQVDRRRQKRQRQQK